MGNEICRFIAFRQTTETKKDLYVVASISSWPCLAFLPGPAWLYLSKIRQAAASKVIYVPSRAAMNQNCHSFN